MKITYTAPNKSHHYPYAEALNRGNNLHAFVAGYSRLRPGSALPSIREKLKRHDFFQSLYLAGLITRSPRFVTSTLNLLSNDRLDKASYKWAKESDAFIFYRTQGILSTRRLHKQGSKTLCIMEEVNSHVENMNEILTNEYRKLGLGEYRNEVPDYNLRLEAYDEADYILCPSQFVVQSFIDKGFSSDRLIKVNFGFPPITSIENQKISSVYDDTFRVLYVGQIHFRKGLLYAIEAFRKLKHPKKEFIIVGPKTRITGLDNLIIPKEVTFTGVLKGEDLKNQYRSASVFILPSLEEGLALVQGEALSFGLPLIITQNTGGADIIKNGVEGFITQPGNVNELLESLQKLADDKELIQQMSCASLIAARNLGSWDMAADKLVLEVKNKIENRSLILNRK